MAEQKRDPRKADIEALAARLFAQSLQQERGQTLASHLAVKALNAATEFYKACDQPTEG